MKRKRKKHAKHTRVEAAPDRRWPSDHRRKDRLVPAPSPLPVTNGVVSICVQRHEDRDHRYYPTHCGKPATTYVWHLNRWIAMCGAHRRHHAGAPMRPIGGWNNLRYAMPDE